MKKPKTYEEAILQLEQILNTISDPQTSLEETVKLYAQAAAVMEVCNEKIIGARLQIEEISQKISRSQMTKEVE